MPQALQILQVLFGNLDFKKQADIDSVRRFHSMHSYCVDDKGDIIGLASVGNELTEIRIPAELKALQYLNLSDNPNLKTIHFDTDMPALEHLDLNGNALESITLSQDFSALKHLDASRNQLKEVKAGSLPSLEYLDLSGNQLSQLQLNAGQLKQAYLVDNQLTELSFPTPSIQLEVLHLKNNKLDRLPDNLLALTGLKALYVYRNPLSEIPSELVAKEESDNSLKEIRDYFKAASKKGTIINNRAKLIIVGNGRVGKTSLYRRLAGQWYNKEEKYTHGIQLGKLNETHLPGVNKTDELDLQVWDFGGQEIFYATHQFFLSEEAVYILAWTDEKNVLDYRERDKEILPFDEKWRSCEYWLENIRLHGKESPIIMVQTHSDILQNKQSNEAAWEQPPYKANTINFSAAKDFGLSELKTYLEYCLNTTIPFLGQDFPRTYNNVLQEIMRLKSEQAFISHGQFLDICKTEEIDIGGEETVLTYLKKAGYVVYFDKPLLREILYIDPNWLTEQVYKLINNHLRTKKGRINQAYLKEILPEPEYDDTQRAQFIELLKSFELIFKPADEEGYIAPQYLPEQLEPMAKKLYDRAFKKLSLGFVFRFPKFLPDNVMINFLSRYGPYSDQVYWKNGICFSDEKGTDCIVRFEEKNRSLFVYTEKSQEGYTLQREVCQAFVELSKNANAEISLDSEVFASWQEVDRYLNLPDPNPEQQFFATDSRTPLKLGDFVRFSEKGMHIMENSRKHKKDKLDMEELYELVGQNRLDQAIQLLKEKAPNQQLIAETAQLEQKWNDFKRKDRMGLLSHSESNVERARIVNAILELAKEFINYDEPVSQNPDITAPNGGKSRVKKILFICSSPNEQVRLDFGRELRKIEDARMNSISRDQFEEIEIITGAQFDRLPMVLRRKKPNILHISLHASKSQGLYFEDEAGNPDPVSSKDFADVIELYNSSAHETAIETLILSACNSYPHAEAVQGLCTNVVGMRDFIPDKAGILYAQHFYQNLFDEYNNDGIQFAHQAALIPLKRREEQFKFAGQKYPVHEIPVLLSH